MPGNWLIVFILFCTLSFSQAQGLFETAIYDSRENELPGESFFLSGYGRGVAYFGGDLFDYASLFGEFALQGRISAEGAYVYADVRFRDGLFFGERQSHVQIKEVYAAIIFKDIDFFIGNQVVRWGRTDGFNPIDNINPRDYFFLSPDTDDQLAGNFMLRSRIRPFRNTELEIIAIPIYKPSVYRYELFDMGKGSFFEEILLPEADFKNGSIAIRYNIELPSTGFAFSWFNGFDPFYGFNLEKISFLPEFTIEYRPDIYRKNAFGFDMVIPLNSTIFRFESALNMTETFQDKMYVPNPDFYFVGGVEQNFSGTIAIFQYIGKYVIDFEPLKEPLAPDPLNLNGLNQFVNEMVVYKSTLYNRLIFNQQKKFNNALFAFFSRSFLHEELRAEFTFYYNTTSEEHFIRPEVKWNVMDGLQVSAGGYFMKGHDDSIFDMAGKILGGFFTGIRMTF